MASVIGPLAGGGFTDSSLSWSVILPVGGFTLLVIIFFLRFPPQEDKSILEKLKSVDYLGLLLILGSVTSILLPVQLGGSTWAWDSWYTIFCFVLAVVLIALLVFVELKIAEEPIIPANVFMNVTVFATLFIAFMLGGAFLAVVYYIPTYFQVVQNDGATTSGLKTIPLVVGILMLSISSGFIISKTGKMTIFFWFGGAVSALGIALLSTLEVDTPYWKIAIYLWICGIGVGSMLQTRVLALQAAVDAPKIAVATSLSGFFQTLGGAISISIFGVVFTNKVYDTLLEKIPKQFATPEKIKALANAPNSIRTIVKAIPGGEQYILPAYLESFVIGLRYAFYTAIPFAGLIFIAAFFVKNYSLPQKAKVEVDEEKINVEVEAENVENESGEVTQIESEKATA
ncbi:hypothetical protein HK096_003603 [Nowakowskiella sp. JEL0078]|nr:hypothetical protein HK096_003603 [Nowakowskiella sp. JEL0078]